MCRSIEYRVLRKDAVNHEGTSQLCFAMIECVINTKRFWEEITLHSATLWHQLLYKFLSEANAFIVDIVNVIEVPDENFILTKVAGGKITKQAHFDVVLHCLSNDSLNRASSCVSGSLEEFISEYNGTARIRCSSGHSAVINLSGECYRLGDTITAQWVGGQLIAVTTQIEQNHTTEVIPVLCCDCKEQISHNSESGHGHTKCPSTGRAHPVLGELRFVAQNRRLQWKRTTQNGIVCVDLFFTNSKKR